MQAVDTFTEHLESIVASVRSKVEALPLPPDCYPQFYVERSGDDVVLRVLKDIPTPAKVVVVRYPAS